MRKVLFISSVLITAGCAGLWYYKVIAGRTASAAYDELQQGHTREAVVLGRRALREEAASPYRWCDAAEALEEAGDGARARYAMERATELAPRVAAVWMRAAKFYFGNEMTEQALRCASRVVGMTGKYDGVIFSYCDRMARPERVLAHLAGERRGGEAYLRHEMKMQDSAGAALGWRWLEQNGYADDAMASEYVDYLLEKKKAEEAWEAWREYAGAENHRGVYNGGFERAFRGAAFDWRIVPKAGVEAGRAEGGKAGRWALRIRFGGTENVEYGNVQEMVWVRPGRYRLSGWVRTAGITTNEGVRLRVTDAWEAGRLDAQTGGFTGTQGWRRVEREVEIGEPTRLVRVAVARRASLKFDNKIAGTAWIDEVALERE